MTRHYKHLIYIALVSALIGGAILLRYADPFFVGALPPGPAPKEGGWFTRLRERWGHSAKEKK